tara:strand:+ start:271 stop:894 length:624 start_codon:yes stop_codon:yes gene_type:complete
MRGLNGNQAAQPRILAHDMVPVAIGAINPRQEGTGALHNEVYNGLEMTAAGAGYSAGDIITLSTGAAATEAAKVKILTVDSAGAITSFELSFTGTVNKPYGEGYVVGDTLSDAGAGVSTFTVKNIDLPNTHERGCCLYAGIAIDTGLDLILESGELYNGDPANPLVGDYTARLKGITAGSFLPVLAKRVVAVTATTPFVAGDLVAIY